MGWTETVIFSSYFPVVFIEGSLDVNLPIMGQMEKQRWEESERRREEERRSEKRKSEKKRRCRREKVGQS